MLKERKPRYTICNIITDDIQLLKQSDEIRKFGITHLEIYKRGMEVISQEMLSQNNVA